MKNKIYIFGLVAILFMSLFACKFKDKYVYYKYTGFIQGTTFSVIYEYNDDIAVEIDSLLQVFNESLNNYDSLSLISRINRNETTKTDSLFEAMFSIAEDMHKISDGRFDISIAPLVNAWGFGYKTGNLPDSTTVDSLCSIVGFENLSLQNHRFLKTDPRIELIGNAVAQGMSVDFLANYMKELGIENFLVEIGGEVFALGENISGNVWTVGIDKPIQDSLVLNREVLSKIQLSAQAIATSGNYRKYHIVNGKAMGHALNPITGYSQYTDILSASVIHDECGYADAWATTLMLMNSQEAIQLVKQHPEIEVMLIIGSTEEQGSYKIFLTDNFPEIETE